MSLYVGLDIKDIGVVYEDDHIAVVVKPQGITTLPTPKGQGDQVFICAIIIANLISSPTQVSVVLRREIVAFQESGDRI